VAFVEEYESEALQAMQDNIEAPRSMQVEGQE
jgi:hypothetical protein